MGKTSPIWDYFVEDSSDPTNVLCTVPGCKSRKVSRGKTGLNKATLSNTPMMNHLKLFHPKVNAEFIKKKADKEVSSGEKRKEYDEDEMESGTVPIFNLRTNKKRKEFMDQSKISSFTVGNPSSGATYEIHDARAKEKHRGILMMVVLDLQPWSIVNDPGFLYYSNQMDPHYKVASDKFYRGLLDKAFKKSVQKVDLMMGIILVRTLGVS